jgi:hypothetical protein
MAGTCLCALGCVTAGLLRRGDLFFLYLAAIAAYFGIVAEGQIDAPYRQLTIIPPLAVFVALGAVAIQSALVASVGSWGRFIASGRWQTLASVAGCCLLIGGMALERRSEIMRRDPLRPASDYRWQLAQEIKKHAGPGSKLAVAGEYDIALGGNDVSPVLYHYTGLQGWTLQPQDWSLQKIESLVYKGATHFVAVSPWGKSNSDGSIPDFLIWRPVPRTH